MRKLKRFLVLIIAIFFTVIPLSENRFIVPASPPIGLGSRGDDVADIQQRLKNWGYYDGEIDAEYNQKTFEAVSNFQRKFGLAVSGTVDGETLLQMGLSRIIQTGSVYAEGTGTSDEQLLARAINGEARGEPYEGQVAVGAVILNRVRDPRFPKTIAGVIYQQIGRASCRERV